MTRVRRLAGGGGLLVAAGMLVAAADATIVEPYRLTTTSVALPPGPLREAMAGERLVHLSDLHFKGMGLRERRLLDALRRIKPALILMTGDYADTPEGIEGLREFFSQVDAPLGIYAVPGNNDYFRGRQAEIFAALREAGVRILVNEVATIEARAGPIAIAGVDDPFFGRDDLPAVMARVPPRLPAILLAHSPSILMERSEAMLFNAGDADGPWGEGSFWTDGSHFREPVAPVRFLGSGRRRMTIQVREDGVGIEAVKLVPADPDGHVAAPPRGLQGTGRRPPLDMPGVIDIDLCAATHAGGAPGWHAVASGGAACALAYLPDSGRLQSIALADPGDEIVVTFDAPEGTAYRVWVRLRSPDSSGLSDSLYVQFDSAVGPEGQPRYRAGEAAPAAGGPPLELILAGHTHGGQVRIPWLGPLEWGLIPGDYVAGSYEAEGSLVYVSRGIGTSILPVRFACAPEVVVFGAGEGASDS